MPEGVNSFLAACMTVNPAARDAGLPPFMAPLGKETPLDSSPYVYDIACFANAFAGSEHRRALLSTLLARIAALEQAGIRIDLLLVGGSFLCLGPEPRDIDALGVYTLTCDTEAGAAVLSQAIGSGDTADLHLCPADAHPAVLIKRAIYFSNTFAYDKGTGALDRGIVMVVPRRGAVAA
jgi:hypothetical protein